MCWFCCHLNVQKRGSHALLIAGAGCASAAQWTALSGKLGKGKLSGVCALFSSHSASSNWVTPQVKIKYEKILFKVIVPLNKEAASEYCRLCQRKCGGALGFLSVCAARGLEAFICLRLISPRFLHLCIGKESCSCCIYCCLNTSSKNTSVTV